MTIASDSQALASDILNHADASGFPKWKKGDDLTSASALTLGSDGNAFDIAGTNAITSISTRGIGAIILLHFDAVLTFTHHSTNLVLPDGENITTAAGDVAVLHEYASADWRLVSYSRADAASGVLSVANGGTGAATAAAAASNLGVGTEDSPQFTGIELGHATANTLAASSGDLSIEGNTVYRAGGTDVPVADGGTGASSLTANAVLTGNATSAIQAESDLLFASNKLNPTASAHDAAGTGLTVSAGATTAGTSNNQAGGALTLQGGQGKGSGAGGAIVFQVANEAGSGSSLNSLGTALTINDDSTLTTAGAIELGHASDTTIARSGSGDITIEGNAVYRAGGTDVPVADGGTGASSLTANGVLVGNGTSAVSAVDLSTKGHVLVSDGSGNPSALAVGSNDQILIADSGEATGVKWGAGASGGIASLAADSSPQLGGFLDANGNYMQTEKGGDISSASPLVIDTDGDYFDVTGTTNYAAMTVAADRQFTLQFDGALTMTHHATNLDLPGEANITTAAGDVGVFQSTGANTVQCISYTKADGTAVVAAAAGGITHASQWRLTTNFTGDQAPISSNLEEVDAPAGFGILGSSMTESSGNFTFPSTGYWLIQFNALYNYTSSSTYTDSSIWVTTDNSTYNRATYGRSGINASGPQFGNPFSQYIVDVTSTSNVKVQFQVKTEDDSATCKGNTGYNYTHMTFIRLGDT